MKSYLAHTLTYDTRDDPILSRSGTFFKSRNELAGLLGNSKFFRSETDVQISNVLPFGFVLNIFSKLMTSLQI